MKKKTVIITFIALCFTFCSLKREKEKFTFDFSNRIYSFLLEKEISNEIHTDSIFISEQTNNTYKDCVFSELLSDTLLSKKMTQSCADFLNKNKTETHFLEKKLKYPVISNSYGVLSKKNVVRFSNIGYSADKKTALLYMEFNSQLLGGFGAYYFLRIGDKKIDIIKKKYAWSG